MKHDQWSAQSDIPKLIKLARVLEDSVPPPWECPIDDALSLSEWYYEYNGAGGWLHITLDDCNLEDSSVDHCISHALSEGDIVCYLLAILIRTMTEENRQILFNRLHGYPDDYKEPC